MKSILLPLIFCFSVSFAFAQHDHESHGAITSKPIGNSSEGEDTTLLIKETEFDFGKIPQGKPVHHNFLVLNQGSKPLKLVNVQASCGCTTPEWEKDKEIPSGESSIIKVGYNAASEGQFTKHITITYGDALTKQIIIKGEVWKTPSASAPTNSGINDLKDK